MSPNRGISLLSEFPLWDGKHFCPIDVPRRLLELVGNPQDKLAMVHIGGTNGKGTVCALAAAMLRASGRSVGQFASPHLSHVTERCLINGLPCSEDMLGDAVERVMALCEEHRMKPSYFVLGAVASFIVFAEMDLDYGVIEVGLGGRFDATNVIARPAASAIASIGFDHMHILGDTLEAIAREKAGIMRRGVPAFVGSVEDSVRAVLAREAELSGAKIEFFGREFGYDSQTEELYSGMRRVKLGLEGRFLKASHNISNAALASRIGIELGLSDAEIQTGLKSARWPGRIEHAGPRVLTGGRTVELLIDAAHNPDGVRVLVSYLEDYVAQLDGLTDIIFVLSFLERKEWEKMIEIFRDFSRRERERFGIKTHWIATHSGTSGAVSPESIKQFIGEADAAGDPKEAVLLGYEKVSSRGLLVAAGSIYLLGKLRPLFFDKPFRTIETEN